MYQKIRGNPRISEVAKQKSASTLWAGDEGDCRSRGEHQLRTLGSLEETVFSSSAHHLELQNLNGTNVSNLCQDPKSLKVNIR